MIEEQRVRERRSGGSATGSRVRVTSEIGALRTVLCHTPGAELLAVTPMTREDFLYDDIIDLDAAVREHKRFKAILSRFAEVHEVRDLLADIIETPEARSFLIERVMDVARSEPLGAFLQELPGEELVSMFIEGREVEEGPLARMLNVQSYALPPLPNLFFTRDVAMGINDHIMIGSMRYGIRWSEELIMKMLFRYHPALTNQGILYDGSAERRYNYTLEGGDVLVMLRATLDDAPAQLEAVLTTELHVRDDHVEVLLRDGSERRLGLGEPDDLVIPRHQKLREHLAHRRFVVDDEYPSSQCILSIGRCTATDVPRPSSLSISMNPPCSRTIPCTTVSPRDGPRIPGRWV